MEVWVMRHGETSENQKDIVQGHRSNTLSELGIRQARLASERLTKIDFEAIYVSDLKRTMQTAKPLVKEVKSKIPVLNTPILREKCGGVMEGRPISEAEEMAEMSQLPPRKYKPEDGESWEDVKRRAEYSLNALIEYHVLGNAKVDFTNRDESLFDHFKPSRMRRQVQESQPQDDEQEENDDVCLELAESKREDLKRLRVMSFDSAETEEQKANEMEKALVLKHSKSVAPGDFKPKKQKGRKAPSNLKKILLISHGGFMEELHNVVKERKEAKIGDTYIKNTGIFRYRVFKDEETQQLNYMVVSENDTAHLKGGSLVLPKKKKK